MNRHKNEKGIALILAIIVVTMVSLLLTSYVAMTISERKRVEHESAAASAEYIARAGLERAFFDLSCEYEKDRDWINENRINGRIINNQNGDDIVDAGEGMPAFNLGAQTEAPGERSDYQDFYGTDASRIAFADGTYWVEIAFVNNTTDDAFLANRLWVRSTGTVTATGGTVTLTQLARVKRVKNITIDGGLGRLYDTLDPAETEANTGDELRITGDILDEDVTIGGKNVTIKGGYGYDFSDGSRDTSKNVSTLKDSGAAPVVTLSGAGTVIMGGVRIE